MRQFLLGLYGMHLSRFTTVLNLLGFELGVDRGHDPQAMPPVCNGTGEDEVKLRALPVSM